MITRHPPFTFAVGGVSTGVRETRGLHRCRNEAQARLTSHLANGRGRYYSGEFTGVYASGGHLIFGHAAHPRSAWRASLADYSRSQVYAGIYGNGVLFQSE